MRGQVLIVLRVADADVAAGHHHFGTERFEVEDFLLAHFVGNNQDQAVAFARCDERQGDTGVAGRGFDEHAAGGELPAALGGFDHRAADAVFDRAAGILALELHQQAAAAGVELLQFDQRRLTDQVQQVGMGRHDRSSRGARA